MGRACRQGCGANGVSPGAWCWRGICRRVGGCCMPCPWCRARSVAAPCASCMYRYRCLLHRRHPCSPIARLLPSTGAARVARRQRRRPRPAWSSRGRRRCSSAPSLVDQARGLVRRHADAATTFARDPLADRPARLPAADTGRFRMRAAITPASAIAWVGKHLTAPAGYEQDPCPRNQRNIAGLLAQGDSARLQIELDFERRHCRP